MSDTTPTAPVAPASLRARLATPVIAPLLADRRLSAVLAAAGAAQVALTFAHVGGWPCPFLAVTGLPCPGCGLSRACAAVCRGQWAVAVRLHAFAPVVLLAIGLMTAAAVLPAANRQRIIRLVSHVERRWPAATVLLGLLLLYWLVRIGYVPDELARVAAPGF